MPNFNVKNLFIVGAGFSQYAGLPLSGEFTDALLEAREFRGGQSRILVEFLGSFIHDAFGHSSSAEAKFWPTLEDLFTLVDQSANSGHHLGPYFAAADLRTVRRALLSRTITMLYQRQRNPRRRKPSEWRQLKYFFERINPKQAGFISMNWDTVIERRLLGMHPDQPFEYCCDALFAFFPEGYDTIRPLSPWIARREIEGSTPLIKIHGSSNWLYCDNCRALFWFDPSETPRIADQIIGQDDLTRIKKLMPGKKRPRTEDVAGRGTAWKCPCSGQVPLGTRIATFSYQKALDFPMFQKSWLSAERLLQDAEKWSFIGYSLPPADYEFKYLLKRVQLARARPPRIAVVSGGTKAALNATYKNYQRFFGTMIKKKGKHANFFSAGLSNEAIESITR